MGLEKVIPQLADLDIFLTLLSRRASGQKLTSYVSFLTGVKRSPIEEGPDELHVIILDNGRTNILSGGEQHRLISLLPPVHVCFLDPSRIFASLTELLAHMQVSYEALPQALTCITGPSRTADIEQTITMGVHGPRAFHVILLPLTEFE